MTRPTRFELLSKFFPELRDYSASKGDKQASMTYSLLACEVILADQLKYFDRGYESFGPGVLCVRLHQQAEHCEYLPLADLVLDHDTAIRANDESTKDFLSDLINTVKETNFDKCGLVLLCDNSSAQAFPIDREFPAKSIQAMLEEFTA